MAGDGELPRRTLEPGEVLFPQGAFGVDIFLLLDGVLEVAELARSRAPQDA